ncbi:hypothetical protein D6C99_01868 [Aureobasidium pullulans]|nr:hypothetical protein D6C99_01868 [Aureobasidium pullulans]
MSNKVSFSSSLLATGSWSSISLGRISDSLLDLRCALYAVAIGLRSENYTAPLNFDDSSTQESMCFDQLLHYIVPAGEQLRLAHKGIVPLSMLPDLQGFFNVDMISHIIAHYNSSTLTSSKAKVFAISRDATYEISSALPPHLAKAVKSVFIHNIDNMHWEGYGPQSVGKVSHHAVAASPDDSAPPRDSAPASTAHGATSNDKYKIAELKYRQKFGIAADVELNRDDVLLVVSIDDGPAGVVDSDDEEEEESPPVKPLDDTAAAADTPPIADGIQLYPMAGKDDIPEKIAIVRIQNPKDSSDDWDKVKSSHSFRCKVKIMKPNQKWSNTPWYPNERSTDLGVSLTFSIESADGCAPRIRLTQDLRRPEHALNSKSQQVPAHSGSVEFAFGHIFKKSVDESTTPNQIFNLKVDYAQEHSNAIISFDTTGAIANNLKCLIDFPEGHDRVRNLRLRDYEVEMTKQLCSLTTIPEGKVKHVVIMVQPHPKEKDLHKAGQHNAVDDLLDALPFEGNVSPSLKQPMTVLPYDQLRNASHKPRVQHGMMPQPFKVFDKNHACMPMPPRFSWQDADEAAIVLANSVAVQHTESTIILSSLEHRQQKVKLLTVGDMVFIAITYDKRLTAGLSTDERISFPVGTKIDFSIHKAASQTASSETVKPYYANGKVVSNIYNVVCDAIVAVENKKAQDFVGLTSPIASSKVATSFWASLTSKIADNSCAAMINAVALTYARESWVTKQWPALLNDGAKLASRDLLDSITCKLEQYTQARNNLMTAHKWNTAQLAHINAFLKAPGGMAPLVGSSGSGKTEVMVHLMRFCLKVGIKVLCIGMKHATLDLVVERYKNKFPNEEQPLRAYAPSTESITSTTRKFKTNSIRQRVIENSKRSDLPSLKRRFPSGSENGYPVYDEETLFDFRQIFRDGLVHSSSGKEYWTDKHLKQFKYTYTVLRAEVIQNAKLLVTTMVNVGNEEISKHFSRRTPIARFDVEAHACAEQPSLIASATCEFSKNICVWAMYGDLGKRGVFNRTGRGTENTVDVFYKQSDVSLFLRLYHSGHPFVRLSTR